MAIKGGAIANADSHYLVEIYAYEVGTAAERILRFGNFELVTEATDSPANVQYHARLHTNYSYDAKMFQKNNALFGPVDTDLGSIQIKFDASVLISEFDISMADMLDLEYSKRRIVIKRGQRGNSIGDFSIIRDGLISTRPKLQNGILTILFSSMEELLKDPIQKNLYAGNNGISGTAKEGDENLEGTPKILTIGTVEKVEPVEVNAVGQIYQVNDGQVRSISSVEDGGNPLTFNSDLTGSAFDAWVKVPGEYITDLARGYIMTGSPITQGLKCTVEGDYDGVSFLSSHSGIIKRILERAGVSSINNSSFTAHHSADNAAAGIVIKSEISAQDIIGQLLVSCGSYAGENANQEYAIGQVSEPANTEDHDLSSGYVHDVSITRISEPYWRMRFTFGPDETDLGLTARLTKPTGPTSAGVISDALGINDKNSPKASEFVPTGSVTTGAVSTPETFKTIYRGAIDGDTRRTFYRSKSDADTELARQLGLFDSPGRFYQINTSLPEGHGIVIGQTVKFSFAPLSITDEKAVVIQVKTTAGPTGNITTIWGYK